MDELGTPSVPIPKPNGGLSLCTDYRSTTNPHLLDARYPIPKIQDIYQKMKFLQVCVYKANLHVGTDDERFKVAAISIHRGT